MADQSDSQRLQANERIKHVAAIFTAWANALVIAGAARIALAEDIERAPIVWFLCAFVLLCGSSYLLTMLREKDEL